MVDDSIVRGNTTRQIVQMLRDAGAREVHMRISRAADPPPLPLRHRHVDARGDDRARPRPWTRSPRELGCDSLSYLSMEGVYEAVGVSSERHCDACFTGRYPLGDADGVGKYALELPLVR